MDRTGMNRAGTGRTGMDRADRGRVQPDSITTGKARQGMSGQSRALVSICILLGWPSAPPPNAEFGPLNAALAPPPQCFFSRFAHFSNTYIHASLEILTFSGFVFRHTLISSQVFFLDLVYMVSVYRCYRSYSVSIY